jgi:hypothetical protein
VTPYSPGCAPSSSVCVRKTKFPFASAVATGFGSFNLAFSCGCNTINAPAHGSPFEVFTTPPEGTALLEWPEQPNRVNKKKDAKIQDTDRDRVTIWLHAPKLLKINHHFLQI